MQILYIKEIIKNKGKLHKCVKDNNGISFRQPSQR